MKKPIFFFAFANDQVNTENYLRNLSDELRVIRKTLEQAESDGLCKIIDRSNATIDEIFDVFQDKRNAENIAFFHYGGHADSYQLLLESTTQDKSVAHAEGLVPFLSRQKGLKLVFLNGCSTEKQANELIDAGIPAVIGTATRIDDKVAKTLASRFYQGLGNGLTIGVAWKDAIDNINTKGGELYRGIGTQKTIADRFPWELYIREGAENVKTWNLPAAVNNPLYGLPALSSDYHLPEKPFRYLQRYERQHAEVFFGRGVLIRKLYEQLKSPNSQPVILLHGQSGVGKSSLLEAGLFPRLEEDCQIKLVRRDASIGLVEGLKKLLQVESNESCKAAWVNLEAENEKPLHIILDQVEEIFTQPNQSLPSELKDLCRIIKDVFYHKKEAPKGKLILSYRKEFHSEINTALKEMEVPRSEIFVEKLNRASIIEAVEGLTKTEKLRNTYNLTVEENLPIIIADDLVEDRVSAIAPVLQILLNKMWEDSESSSHKREFTILNYQKLKKSGYLLSDFLNEKLAELATWKKEVVSSGLVLDLLAFHTTEDATAKQNKRDQIINHYAHRKDLINELIQKIKDSYLLTEIDDGAATMTLAHDTLAVLVKKRFDNSDLPGPKAYRILKNKINDWKEKKSSNLLTEEELNVLKKGKAGMRNWGDEEVQLFENCEKYISKLKLQKRIKNFTISGLLLIGLVGGFFLFRLNTTNKSDQLFRQGQNLSDTNPTLALAKMLEGRNIRTSQTKTGVICNLFRDNLFYKTLLKDENATINVLAVNPKATVFAFTKKNELPIYIYEWQDAKAKLLNTLEGVDNDIVTLKFSDDGRYLLGGATDRKAHIWDWKTRNHQVLSSQEGIFSGHVNVVCFSTNGNTVATGQAEKLRIWNINSGNIIDSLSLNTKISALAYAADNATLWIGEENGNLTSYNSNTSQKQLLYNDTSTVKAIYSLGNTSNMMHLSEKGIYTWNTTNNPVVEKIIGKERERKQYTDGVVSSNGQLILSNSKDKIARLWNVDSGKLLNTLKGHDQLIGGLGFSENDNVAITASNQNVFYWTLPNHLPIQTLQDDENSIEALTLLEEGKKIIAGTGKPSVDVWDLSTNRLASSKKSDSRIEAIAANEQKEMIISGDKKGQLQSWTMGQEGSQSIHQFKQKIRTISAKNGTALIAANEKNAYAWNGKNAAPSPLVGHSQNVLCTAISKDGQRGLTGGADQLVILWDLINHKKLAEFKHEKGEVRALTFFDGDSFLSVDANSNLYYWNIDDESHESRKLKEDRIQFLEVDEKNRFYVTASNSKIEVWHKEGALIGQYIAPSNDNISALSISADGQKIYTGSQNGKIHIWKNDRLPVYLFD